MPRGSKPGERRGGRKKGTPNKRSAEMVALAQQLNVDPVSGQIELAAWALNEWRKLTEMPAARTPERQLERAALMTQRAEQASAYLAKAAPYIRPRLAVVDASDRRRLKTHEEALAELEAEPLQSQSGVQGSLDFAAGAVARSGALSAAFGDDAEDFGEDA